MKERDYQKKKIKSNLKESISYIKEITGGSSDVLINEFITGGISCCLLCCEGMMSSQTAAEMVLSPITFIPE